jgi:hypothetical protein
VEAIIKKRTGKERGKGRGQRGGKGRKRKEKERDKGHSSFLIPYHMG